MKIERLLTKGLSGPVAESIEWKHAQAMITAASGEIIFQQDDVEVPAQWSQTAINMLAQKYFRKAGVPNKTAYIFDNATTDFPSWLRPSVPILGTKIGFETSARQVFHRMDGCWTYWGWRSGLLTTEDDARAFYDEVYAMLAAQMAAPNSPQWFNTGLHWAYGIEGPDSGQWYCDDEGVPYRIFNSYERPQPHACFIQPVADDLVNEGGMMDLWTKEARLFKHGSGTGSNFSKVRGKDEPLSGGGKSSGLMSFLPVGDRSAGSIKSGGVTRRAAKMVVVNLDHPEIREFVTWKGREEHKAAAIAVGSRTIARHLERICRSVEDDSILLDGHVKDALADGVPQALIDRARSGEGNWVVYDANSWEGPAIETVSGQNANNSVRVTDDFLRRVDEDAEWNLTWRTDGSVCATFPARELWDEICHSTWASGDPGIQFDDTIQAWATCPIDGRIEASNPCSEYLHNDNTACNLASLRLTSFKLVDGTINLDMFEHATRLWTIVLEISNMMASFPSRKIALGTYNYHTIGLGYADAGGLLMRLGIPYDSDDGRALIAGLTALMTGVAYATSAEMASEVGPFPRWEANAGAMRRVLRNHAHALTNETLDGVNADSYRAIFAGSNYIREQAKVVWSGVLEAESFRNAQVTLIAPTGTISFVMDCDTTGIEPEFALVHHKSLAGGGQMRLVNQAVAEALARLGYGQQQIEEIKAGIEATGGFPEAPAWLKNLSGATLERHLAVFDCANPAPGRTRALRPMAHVLMVAAIQPFLSGAASKTVNLPNTATVEDVRHIYREAHRLGVKAIAPYRDGSKLTQPHVAASAAPLLISDKKIGKVIFDDPQISDEERHAAKVYFGISNLARGTREALPSRRSGITQKARIGGQSLYWRTGEYPDGRLGEVFIDLAGVGSTLNGFANCLAKMSSIALQYGAPADKIIDALMGIKFEPAGVVEMHPDIRMAHSIPDLVARDLAINYLGCTDLAHVIRAVPMGEDREVMALDRRAVAIASGQLTGQDCHICGGMLRQTGPCVTCENCGDNSGCG